IYLNKNYGPSFARNVGIRYMWEETDAFMICDADDIMYPEKIEKMVERMFNNSMIGVVYADYHIFDVDKNVTTLELKHPYSKQELDQMCIVHSQSLINKQ